MWPTQNEFFGVLGIDSDQIMLDKVAGYAHIFNIDLAKSLRGETYFPKQIYL
jgi:hypothetical protein